MSWSSVADSLSSASVAVATTFPLRTTSAFASGNWDRAVAFTRTFGFSPASTTLPGPLPFTVNSSIGPLVTNDRPAFNPSIQVS